MNRDLNKILKFRDRRDWKQFHLPKNLAISLVLEATEALEIFQWTKDHHLPVNKMKELERELADVYYYLLLLAHESGVDIQKAFKKKMRLNEKNYPVKKARGTAKKYTELK